MFMYYTMNTSFNVMNLTSDCQLNDLPHADEINLQLLYVTKSYSPTLLVDTWYVYLGKCSYTARRLSFFRFRPYICNFFGYRVRVQFIAESDLSDNGKVHWSDSSPPLLRDTTAATHRKSYCSNLDRQSFLEHPKVG